MRISTITWLAAIIICCYWLTSLATAYQEALGHYYMIKNSQIAHVLEGK